MLRVREPGAGVLLRAGSRRRRPSPRGHPRGVQVSPRGPPRSCTHLLLNGAQQPLPGLRLCGEKREKPVSAPRPDPAARAPGPPPALPAGAAAMAALLRSAAPVTGAGPLRGAGPCPPGRTAHPRPLGRGRRRRRQSVCAAGPRAHRGHPTGPGPSARGPRPPTGPRGGP